MNNAGKGRRFPTSPNPPLHLPTSLLQERRYAPRMPERGLKSNAKCKNSEKTLGRTPQNA